jgi:hypothetical protein
MTTFLFTIGGVAIGVCAIASMVIVGQAGKKSELRKAAEVVASVAGIVLAICFIAGIMLNGVRDRRVVAQETQTQPNKPQATPSALDDGPGAKPDAHDPASKIDQITAVLKSDPKYKFLKYEIWPGEYQKQKVWTIDYYFSERGLDGVFVLKHLACYFRRGKIVGNTDPISVEEENAKPKDEGGASRTADGAWKDLSHSTQEEVESAAAEDAQYAWRKLHLRQGSDGHFNWFEIGMKISDAQDTFHQRHVLVKGPVEEAYDKKFEASFTAIAKGLQPNDSL